MHTDKLDPKERQTLDAAGLTHVGQRRQRNEDQFLIATLQRSLAVRNTSIKADALHWLPASAEGTILMVADGMGGTADGAIASSLAVRSIGNYLCNVLPWLDESRGTEGAPPPTLPGIREGLESALVEGDAEVRRAAAANELSADMGTTVTIAYVAWPLLYVAHAGDSRCYLYRDRELTQLTTDHTLAQKMREHTDIPVDSSSPWHHALWNVLGGGDNIELEPEVRRCLLLPDDVLLLCTDGLTKHVHDRELAAVLAAHPSPAAACAILVDQANAAGGSDNITAVVARRPAEDRGITRSLEGPTRLRGPID